MRFFCPIFDFLKEFRGVPNAFEGVLTVSIHFVDHVLEFCFCGVLAQGSHDCAQFLGGDGAIAVLVEKGEGFLEFGNLLFGQLVGLKRKWQTALEKKNGKLR